jgi:hypothetical protein
LLDGKEIFVGEFLRHVLTKDKEFESRRAQRPRRFFVFFAFFACLSVNQFLSELSPSINRLSAPSVRSTGVA